MARVAISTELSRGSGGPHGERLGLPPGFGIFNLDRQHLIGSLQ